MKHPQNYIYAILLTLSQLAITVVLATTEKANFEYENWQGKPKEGFKQAKESFEKARELLLKRYYEKGLTEEDIYRAAVKGMMENLDPKMAEWNRLLSPMERKELQNDFSGEVIGSGVEITFNSESGLAEVIYVIPNSPAEKAGITKGDNILSINGETYKGKQIRDFVYDMRGKAGEKRDLRLLRKDKLLTKTLELKSIPYSNVVWNLLPDKMGLLSIHYFTENTSTQVKEAINQMNQQNIRGLIIDLRGNEGGVFKSATDTAAYFLPKGNTIVNVSRRNGSTERITSQANPLLSGIPIIILLNELTSSGAEVFSAALHDNLGTTLIGNHTHGKWSVQTIEELPNQYAVKFTVGLMTSPKGKDYSGTGISPDIEIAADANEVRQWQRIVDLTKRMERDNSLRTAAQLLKAKG